MRKIADINSKYDEESKLAHFIFYSNEYVH